MVVAAKPRATYADVLENGRYSILATHKDDEVVRAQPFDAIELGLADLWADVDRGSG